ncbi:hypothetical protein BYT27DRAFT_7154224 [Phlegmacium glaucopus]|nr:hypothetical protein BYT27DRAFT_7154224 [Phlegmacium glaucopus]
MSYNCVGCSRTFNSTQALSSHCRMTGHIYSVPQCHLCGKVFVTDQDLERHLHSAAHGYCVKCKRQLANKDGLQQHLRSPAHDYCLGCGKQFSSQQALQQHLHSAAHNYCAKCGRQFCGREALEQVRSDYNSGCKVSLSKIYSTCRIHLHIDCEYEQTLIQRG